LNSLFQKTKNDLCHAIQAASAVNTGAVTTQDMNSALSTDSKLTGLLIVVTVITQAEHKADGSTHWQVFIDVSGASLPSADQLEAICKRAAEISGSRLNIPSLEIKCDLKPKATKRQITQSYIADLTVNQQPHNNMEGSAGVIAASGLLIAAATAIAL
jgi:hypothetical protein